MCLARDERPRQGHFVLVRDPLPSVPVAHLGAGDLRSIARIEFTCRLKYTPHLEWPDTAQVSARSRARFTNAPLRPGRTG